MCMAASDFVGAMKWYSQAISLAPRDAALYSNRSFAFLRLCQTSRALADADEAVRRRPEWPKGHYRRAEALTQAGLHADALQAYERGASLDPSDEHLRCQCAEARVRETEARRRELIQVTIAAVSLLSVVLLLGAQSETSRLMQAAGALAGLLFGTLGGVAFVCLMRQQRRGGVLPPLQSNEAFAAMQMKGDRHGAGEIRTPAQAQSSNGAGAIGACASSTNSSGGGEAQPSSSSDAKRRVRSTANGRNAAMRALGKKT